MVTMNIFFVQNNGAKNDAGTDSGTTFQDVKTQTVNV